MNQEAKTFVLPDTVSSEQDLNGLVVEIHECLKWLSHETVKKQSGAENASPMPNISPAAQELIKRHGSNQEDLETIINQLETLRRKSRIITITLAAPATGSIKKTLVSWAREQIAPDVLVNFSFNRAILGGMVVRAGSRVFDWSFRRKILAADGKFPEAFRNVR